MHRLLICFPFLVGGTLQAADGVLRDKECTALVSAAYTDMQVAVVSPDKLAHLSFNAYVSQEALARIAAMATVAAPNSPIYVVEAFSVEATDVLGATVRELDGDSPLIQTLSKFRENVHFEMIADQKDSFLMIVGRRADLTPYVVTVRKAARPGPKIRNH